MAELWKHGGKLDTKGHVLCDLIYTNSEKSKSIETEKRLMVGKGCGRRESRMTANGQEFLFWGEKYPELDHDDGYGTLWIY